MFYKLEEDVYSYGFIFVSEAFAKVKELYEGTQIIINAGLRKMQGEVKISEKLNEDTFLISKDILDNLSIPININYQVSFSENNFYFGPVIGLLISAKRKELINDIEFVKKQNDLSYCPPSGFCRSTTVAYPGIGGLLYVFSTDGIDIENNEVKGFYYNPNWENVDDMWKEGRFPLPSVVYKRVYMFRSKKRNELISLTGNKVFNSSWFNKLDFWIEASKYSDIKEYLPYTETFRSYNNLNRMLNIFNTVYIKKISGELAQGLVKVKKEGNQYFVQQAFDKVPEVFNNEDELRIYLRRILYNIGYLLQQGVEPIKYNDGYTIFRVIMQKDETLKWKCTGVCPRVGNSGGICTNYAPEAYVFTFEEFMREVLKLEEDEICQKKQELLDLSFKLCEMMDTWGGNFGDVGIDIAIDETLKYWIFEINAGHHQYVPLKVKDEKMYFDLKSNILRYAVGLSGFGYFSDKVNI